MIKNLLSDYQRFANRKDDSHYSIQESILKKLVADHPGHTNYAAVEVKAKLLNLFYSTGIQAMDKMVENIMSIANIDEILKEEKCCPELVHKIARLQLTDTERDNYSFATKYCALHQPKKYPIYDSIVASVFTELMMQDQLPPYSLNKGRKVKSTDTCKTKSEFREMLRDYVSYLKVYDAFMKEYGLTSISYREVDLYLWGSFKSPDFNSEIEKMVNIEGKYTETKPHKMPRQTKLNRTNK